VGGGIAWLDGPDLDPFHSFLPDGATKGPQGQKLGRRADESRGPLETAVFEIAYNSQHQGRCPVKTTIRCVRGPIFGQRKLVGGRHGIPENTRVIPLRGGLNTPSGAQLFVADAFPPAKPEHRGGCSSIFSFSSIRFQTTERTTFLAWGPADRAETMLIPGQYFPSSRIAYIGCWRDGASFAKVHVTPGNWTPSGGPDQVPAGRNVVRIGRVVNPVIRPDRAKKNITTRTLQQRQKRPCVTLFPVRGHGKHALGMESSWSGIDDGHGQKKIKKSHLAGFGKLVVAFAMPLDGTTATTLFFFLASKLVLVAGRHSRGSNACRAKHICPAERRPCPHGDRNWSKMIAPLPAGLRSTKKKNLGAKTVAANRASRPPYVRHLERRERFKWTGEAGARGELSWCDGFGALVKAGWAFQLEGRKRRRGDS